MINKREWNNLEKLSKDFNNYSPSELLEKEIDRILKGEEQWKFYLQEQQDFWENMWLMN